MSALAGTMFAVVHGVVGAPDGVAFADRAVLEPRASVTGELVESGPDGPERIAFRSPLQVERTDAAYRLTWGPTKTEGRKKKALIFRGEAFSVSPTGQVASPGPAVTKAAADRREQLLVRIATFYQRLRWHVALLNGLAGRRLVMGQPFRETVELPLGPGPALPVDFEYALVAKGKCPSALPCRTVKVRVAYDSKPILLAGEAGPAVEQIAAAPSVGVYAVMTIPGARRPLSVTGGESIVVEMVVEGRQLKTPGGEARLAMTFSWGDDASAAPQQAAVPASTPAP